MDEKGALLKTREGAVAIYEIQKWHEKKLQEKWGYFVLNVKRNPKMQLASHGCPVTQVYENEVKRK